MLTFKVAFSFISNINQSACSTLEWVLSSQSEFSDCGELRSDSRAYDIARSMVNAGRCDMYVQLQNNSIDLHEKFETVLRDKGVFFIYRFKWSCKTWWGPHFTLLYNTAVWYTARCESFYIMIYIFLQNHMLDTKVFVTSSDGRCFIYHTWFEWYKRINCVDRATNTFQKQF